MNHRITMKRGPLSRAREGTELPTPQENLHRAEGVMIALRWIATPWIFVQGPGVPEAKRDALFEPFGTRSDAGSVGLGLSIVRALVDAHGGRVSYRRNEPAGSCFEVVLPASS